MDSTFYRSSSPLVSGSEQNTVAYFHFYLHQNHRGPNRNQTITASTNESNCFGLIAANDWAIREGREPGSMVIAHAKGLHVACGMNKGKWYNAFNLLFEDRRFKGSSLEVRGTSNQDEPFQWAVVGGTGQFTFAQGFVNGKSILEHSNGRIVELEMHIVYRPLRLLGSPSN